ncbi:MAG: metallophosphoesterase [Clostridia bacterium]|nr:metallophosphoesterase [Clostridia bacterium]
MFLKVLVKMVSVFLTIVMTVSTPAGFVLGKKEAKIARAKDNCGVSFAVISDSHLRGNFKLIFQGMLELGLEDMANAKDRLDAVVFDGDITDGGQIDQWDVFADAVSKYDIADNKFVVVGNHDTWGPNRDDFNNPEDGVKTTFIHYNKVISDRDITEMYYSDIVNGYYFIVLGSEADHVCATISDAQAQWFAQEMEKAAATGLPIFVFLHQPVNGTHGLPYNWELKKDDPEDEGGIGGECEKVVEVLKKYDNVFYISGHIHGGFKNAGYPIGPSYASVEYMENDNGNQITLINLPSYMYFDFIHGGHLVNGCGWVIEAYGDEVLLRARNFATGTWLTGYDVTVDLVK